MDEPSSFSSSSVFRGVLFGFIANVLGQALYAVAGKLENGGPWGVWNETGTHQASYGVAGSISSKVPLVTAT
jgi:hypothetical protein